MPRVFFRLRSMFAAKFPMSAFSVGAKNVHISYDKFPMYTIPKLYTRLT
jgi:hypothetical protein